MTITVFRAFRDPYRLSMDRYADEIVSRVGRLLARDEQIVGRELPSPHLDGWRRYWDQYVKYPRFAAAHAGDVNHIVDHGYGHLTNGLPAGRTVVTFHDAVVMKVPGVGWRTRAAFGRSLRAMRRAAAVVCVSEAGKRDLLELADIPEARVHVIPWGIDESFRPPADRQQVRRGLGLSGDVVLMVGHTQGYMNVARMLRAFGALVAQQGVDATLVKIGLPFEPDEMRLLGELEIGDRVKIVGRVPFADLPAYYQAADVLLYAPLLAGFGLPPLEAMACGTAVVASNRGALPEVAGDAALLVDPEDDTALAHALSQVLTNPVKRRRMVDAGFERAGRFEWTPAARRLLELYRATARA
jgi:glycosyltransferase involved in cell wall biosynthesis